MDYNELNFIKEIPNCMEFFNEEEKKIIELIGSDGFLKLYQRYSKTGLYFSTASITKLKKEWCIRNSHLDYKTIARTLNVSVKSVYRWRHKGLQQKQFLTKNKKELR